MKVVRMAVRLNGHEVIVSKEDVEQLYKMFNTGEVTPTQAVDKVKTYTPTKRRVYISPEQVKLWADVLDLMPKVWPSITKTTERFELLAAETGLSVGIFWGLKGSKAAMSQRTSDALSTWIRRHSAPEGVATPTYSAGV